MLSNCWLPLPEVARLPLLIVLMVLSSYQFLACVHIDNDSDSLVCSPNPFITSLDISSASVTFPDFVIPITFSTFFLFAKICSSNFYFDGITVHLLVVFIIFMFYLLLNFIDL